MRKILNQIVPEMLMGTTSEYPAATDRYEWIPPAVPMSKNNIKRTFKLVVSHSSFPEVEE